MTTEDIFFWQATGSSTTNNKKIEWNSSNYNGKGVKTISSAFQLKANLGKAKMVIT